MTGHDPIERTCTRCGNAFLIPAAERSFRSERGLSDPVACTECRATLRASRNTELIALYERSESLAFTEPPAGRRSAPAQRDRNGHGDHATAPRQRYSTVCAACGAETQVPFIPRGDRPVYCRDCYNARRGR